MTLQIFSEERSGVKTARVTIGGMTGAGKTTLAAAYARKAAPRERWIVIDPVGALGEKLGMDYYKVSGREPERCEKIIRRHLDESERTGAGYLWLIDEMDLLCSSRDYCCDALYELVNQGRNWGNGVVALTRGTNELPKNFIRNSSIVFWSQTVEGNQIDYLNEFMQDQEGHPYEAQLRNLPEHVFMVWEPRAGGGYRGLSKVDSDGDLAEFEVTLENLQSGALEKTEDPGDLPKSSSPTDTTTSTPPPESPPS
jgi:ATPase family associated with various cellular activities (AAA)